MGDQNQDCAAGGSADAEHDHVKKVGFVSGSLFSISLFSRSLYDSIDEHIPQ